MEWMSVGGTLLKAKYIKPNPPQFQALTIYFGSSSWALMHTAPQTMHFTKSFHRSSNSALTLAIEGLTFSPSVRPHFVT